MEQIRESINKLLTYFSIFPSALDRNSCHRSSEGKKSSFFFGWNYCLTFRADDQEEIFGWADSSFNSGDGDRKNRYGYCFQVGRSSGMLIAICKCSTLIPQS